MHEIGNFQEATALDATSAQPVVDIKIMLGTDTFDYAASYAGLSKSETIEAMAAAIVKPNGVAVTVAESGSEATVFGAADGTILRNGLEINGVIINTGCNFIRDYAEAYAKVVDGGEGGDEPIADDAANAAMIDWGCEGVAGATLVHAVEFGAVLTTMAMLRAGYPVNDARACGSPALTVAVRHVEPEIVRLLLDAGADINAQDADGMTALDWALADEWDPKITQLLQAAGKAA